MVLRNVFVTGGTGVIGTKVVDKLVKQGYGIKVLSRKVTPDQKNVKYILGDIGNKELIKKSILDCDYVIHLAACVGGNRSDEEFWKTNVEGTENLLKRIQGMKVNKVVCVSTASIFADCKGKIRDEKWHKNIESDNLYIKSKLRAYEICQRYKNKIPIVTVFPSAVIDISNNENPFKGIMGWMWKMAGGIPGGLIGMIGNKKRIINYVLVDDVAEGIIKAMEKGKIGNDYLLTGENIEIGKFINKMEKVYHQKAVKIRIPLVVVKLMTLVKNAWPKVLYDIGKNGLGDVWFSNSKAKKDLGYIFKIINE